MYVNLFKTVAFCHLQESIEVSDVAVYAAIGEQAIYMQARPLFLCIVHCLQKRIVFEEITVLDFLRDPGQILVHDTAGTYIQVANLGTAHLALRKTHGLTAGITLHEGTLLHQPVQHRSVRQRYGVMLTAIIQAKAVEDQQYSRSVCFLLFRRIHAEGSGQMAGRSYNKKRYQKKQKHQFEMDFYIHQEPPSV